MRIAFIYPRFERHAQSHPELLDCVPATEYIGSPSLGIAAVAACTPAGMDMVFVDDRARPVDQDLPDADLYAISFFTPAATRAFEIASILRASGRKVVAGGIFPTVMPDIAAEFFDAIVIGEGEPVWSDLCLDAARGRLKARYQATAPAVVGSLPAPLVELYLDAETPAVVPDDYPVQISRGCPLACDACALPTCAGPELRHFPDEYVWSTLSRFAARGKHCCLTEDTSLLFARWRFRALMARIAEQRKLDEKPIQLSYIGTAMPMLLSIPDDIFACIREAGVHRFYLVGGFDPVTRSAFGAGDERALAKARRCVARCQDHGVEPYVSFLVGNEGDDEGVFDRILEFATAASLKIAEFTVATPYPGTPMWHKLQKEDRIIDHTWAHYNDANVVFQPKLMSPERLLQGYLHLWREFYRERQHLKQGEGLSKIVQF